MSVYVGFCVCVYVCVLREGFGPNWHRHVKCFREPSWHPCTSKLTRSQQTEQRMNANKSADPWVTLSIPALQAMSAETGRLEGYEISLFKMGTAKKEKKIRLIHNLKWLQRDRRHLNPNKVMIFWWRWLHIPSCSICTFFSVYMQILQKQTYMIKPNPCSVCSAESIIWFDFETPRWINLDINEDKIIFWKLLNKLRCRAPINYGHYGTTTVLT